MNKKEKKDPHAETKDDFQLGGRAPDNWAPRSSNMICQTCMYYVPKPDLEGKRPGRCRKRAPKVGKGWPVVYHSDWCGDHKLA